MAALPTLPTLEVSRRVLDSVRVATFVLVALTLAPSLDLGPVEGWVEWVVSTLAVVTSALVVRQSVTPVADPDFHTFLDYVEQHAFDDPDVDELLLADDEE